MSLCDEIAAARKYGVTRCGFSSKIFPTVTNLAAEFGLLDDPAKYVEITVTSARWILESLLTHDMAYGVEIISAVQASELIERFLSRFGVDGVRYFTNCVLDETQRIKPPWSGVEWNPVTTTTFDSGVLILSPQLSGCLWVEDED